MIVKPTTCDDSRYARQNYVCRAQEKFDCDSTSQIFDATRAAEAARLAARFAARSRRKQTIVGASLFEHTTLTSNA